MIKPLSKLFISLAAVSLLLVSCGPTTAPTAPSKVDRIADPKVADTDSQTLEGGNMAFAFDLYQAVSSSENNLVYSPYSLSLAFALAYAGARGDTADQMAQVLHYPLPADQLPPAFNSLDLALASRPSQATNVDENERFQLNIANSLWGQKDFPFLQAYLDLLAANYGAGMHLVDFQKASESAREQINAWVAEQTQDKIKDILPPGVIDPQTRLVLANAIYFKAFWEAAFDASQTSDQPFHRLDGSTVSVKMMR